MKSHLLISCLAAAGVVLAQAQEPDPVLEPLASDAIVPQNPNWFTGDDITFLDGLISAHLHVVSAFGDTTAEDQADLAVNHHDPQNEATLQSLEPGLSLRAGKLQGFATYSASTDADGVIDGALEEGFLKVIDLPFDTEIRGGQFLNRFGFQNAVHNHGWHYVDQSLVDGRFLNEGELTTLGGELTWNIPVKWGPTALSMSYGGLPAHSHGEEEHGHVEETEFEAEAANFNNWVASANLVSRYDYNDFHQFTAIGSGAWGENEFGSNTQVYGLGLQYEWRQNGYEPGGRYLRWRTQAIVREIEALSGHGHGEEEEHHDEEEEDHHDEEEEEHHDEEEESRSMSLDEFGFYTSLAYGWSDRLETSVRGEWVSGIDEMGLDDRWRISPAATWFFNDYRSSHLRLQYNYDIADSFGEEHSVWLQFQWSFGGPEVR